MGHRGAPYCAPENTPDSFVAAAVAGAEWVELDVRRCRDWTLVVHHDAYRDGVPLVELDAPTLAQRGVWTLGDVLVRLPPGLGVDVEVKNLPTEPDYDESQRIVGLLADVIRPVVGQRPLMTSSFNPLTVQALAAGPDAVPTGLLHGPALQVDAASEVARELGAAVLCSHVDAKPLDKETVTTVRDAGLAVMVWVVDDTAEAVRLADAGVDALCTNDPGGLVAALEGG